MTASATRAMALVFRRAAQILQARGHAKGWFVDDDGCACTMGALLAATGTDPANIPDGGIVDHSPAVVFLSDRLYVAIDDEDPVERIAEWNDKPERTQAEVVAELLSAARDLETRDRNALTPTEVRLRSEVAA